MRIPCPYCESKCRIIQTSRFDAKSADSYADCTNPHCSARIVIGINYKHTVRPPIQEQWNAFEEHFAQMDPARQAELIRKYAPAMSQPSLL